MRSFLFIDDGVVHKKSGGGGIQGEWSGIQMECGGMEQRKIGMRAEQLLVDI